MTITDPTNHEHEMLALIDERDRLENLLDKFAYTIAPQAVIGEHSSGNDPWQNALDLVTPAAKVDELEARIKRVEKLHAPFRIYDECGHRHTEVGNGVQNVTHIGLTCEDGYMYTACRHCCTDAMGDQTEACASEHDHSREICPTRTAIDGATT